MVNKPEVKIREADSGDQQFIDDMNIVAGFGAIRQESEYPDTDKFLESRPEIAAFSRQFGREDDIGLIAEDESGSPIGAVWARRYDRSQEDGVLIDHPFELTIGVKESERNRGIGRQLLRSFIDGLMMEGRDEVALGVHPKSPARKLYEEYGFEPIIDDGKEARLADGFVPMIKKLDKNKTTQ